MKSLFRDLPEAIETIAEIVNKVESYRLDRKVLLPRFEIPKGFDSEDDYLRHLANEGASKKFDKVTPEIRDRIEF